MCGDAKYYEMVAYDVRNRVSWAASGWCLSGAWRRVGQSEAAVPSPDAPHPPPQRHKQTSSRANP